MLESRDPEIKKNNSRDTNGPPYAGKEDYLRPSQHIGLDWITAKQ